MPHSQIDATFLPVGFQLPTPPTPMNTGASIGATLPPKCELSEVPTLPWGLGCALGAGPYLAVLWGFEAARPALCLYLAPLPTIWTWSVTHPLCPRSKQCIRSKCARFFLWGVRRSCTVVCTRVAESGPVRTRLLGSGRFCQTRLVWGACHQLLEPINSHEAQRGPSTEKREG